MVSVTPIICRMAALCRPRMKAPGKVTIGRLCGRLSSAELQPDQPMLSRKTSRQSGRGDEFALAHAVEEDAIIVGRAGRPPRRRD